jgi:protein SCO1/2
VSRKLLLVPLVLASVLCCRREEKREAPAAAAGPARRYELRGVVKGIDRARSEITVDHEAVAGYMPAMTMAFPLRDDPQVIALLRPGDRIEATLVVGDGRFWLEKVLTKGFVPTPATTSGAVTPRPNQAVGLGDAIPDFSLTDQTGATVRLSELRGEPIAVSFLYTQCPIATACPMTTAKFSRLAAILREKKFGRLVVITVDPVHDTPRVLADYAAKAGADPRQWKFLTGNPRAVADVASHFGVLYYPDRVQIVHTQAIAVIDPAGRLSTIYYVDSWQPEEILRDLEKARKG